jgi:hypothetical protein
MVDTARNAEVVLCQPLTNLSWSRRSACFLLKTRGWTQLPTRWWNLPTLVWLLCQPLTNLSWDRRRFDSTTGKLSPEARCIVDTALSLLDNDVPGATRVIPDISAADISRLRSAMKAETWLNNKIISVVSKLIARTCSQATPKKVHAEACV